MIDSASRSFLNMMTSLVWERLKYEDGPSSRLDYLDFNALSPRTQLCSGMPNEQRLSDAAAALDKWRGGAWRQINPVELNRLSMGV